MRLKEAHKIIKSMMERATDRERRALRVAEIHMESQARKEGTPIFYKRGCGER